MKSDKVLVLGKHPVLHDIVRQFEARGAEVCCLPSYSDASLSTGGWNDIVLLTSPDANSDATDEHAVRWLQTYADRLTGSDGAHEHVRPTIHLLLQSQERPRCSCILKKPNNT